MHRERWVLNDLVKVVKEDKLKQAQYKLKFAKSSQKLNKQSHRYLAD